MRLAFALFALALVAPTAIAQTSQVAFVPPDADTPTALYFHLLNVQDFPINTQVPSSEWMQEISYGAGASTATCISSFAGNTGGIANEYHTYRGYSSPGYVEYDNVENGVPMMHPERGLSANVTVQPDGVRLHWFLGASGNAPFLPGPATLESGIPVPNVIVQATMRASDGLSVDDRAYDTGPLLMQGAVGPVTLAAGMGYGQDGRPSPDVVGSAATGEYVYEFIVPMDVLETVIPAQTGFTLRIDIFLDNPACADPGGSGSVMPNLVVPYTDGTHLPRIELLASPDLVVEKPLTLGRPDNSTLLWFNATILSPWGNYDVRVSDLQFDLMGPEGDPDVDLVRVVQRTKEYYHHQDPVEFTWEWRFNGTPADGYYTASMSVPNLQGTAIATSTVSFQLVDGRVSTSSGQELPGLTPLAALALLVGGAVTLRRR